MRGIDDRQDGMFSYVSLGSRVPQNHPLRPVRQMVDEALKAMSRDFSRLIVAPDDVNYRCRSAISHAGVLGRREQDRVEQQTAGTERARVAVHSRWRARDAHRADIEFVDIEVWTSGFKRWQQVPFPELSHAGRLHVVGGMLHLHIARVFVEHEHAVTAARKQHGGGGTRAARAHDDDVIHKRPSGYGADH